MNLRTLATRNVWQKRRQYGAYLFSAAFSVTIYFLYMALAQHPHLQGDYRGAGYIVQAVDGASVVIALFTLLFLLYSGAAFVRMRMKEFGLLTLLGFSRSQLIRLIFWENVVIGIAAVTVGLGTGVLFSKLFFMGISLLLRLPEALPTYVAWPVWRQTIVVFGAIFVFVSLLSLRGVLRRNIIELIRADRQPKATPKFSWVKAIIGLLLVGVGYGWASFPNPIIVMLGIVPVITMVSIGTYFVMREASIAVLALLRRTTRFYYRPQPFLIVSQLGFKVQDNYRVLSAVSLLVAVILSAVGTIFSIYSVVEHDVQINTPQAVQLIMPADYPVDDVTRNVQTILHEHGVNFLTHYTERLPEATLGDMEVTLVPYRMYEALHRPQAKPLPSPAAGTVIRVYDVPQNNWFQMDEQPYSATLQGAGDGHLVQVQRDFGGRLFNGYDLGAAVVVLSDEVFEQWVTNNPHAEYRTVAVWTGSRWGGDTMRAVVADVRELYPTWGESQGEVLFTSTLETYDPMVADFGIALFIGVFVSLVFFAASCSLLYFRLFTEVDEDRRYFTRLQQLGLTIGQLKMLTLLQAGVLFSMPFIVGLVHATFAMGALGTLVSRTVLHYGWAIAIAYLLPYGVYFIITYALYWRTLGLSRPSPANLAM